MRIAFPLLTYYSNTWHSIRWRVLRSFALGVVMHATAHRWFVMVNCCARLTIYFSFCLIIYNKFVLFLNLKWAQYNFVWAKRLSVHTYIDGEFYLRHIFSLEKHINMNIVHIFGRFIGQRLWLEEFLKKQEKDEAKERETYRTLDLKFRMRTRNSNNYLIEWFLLRQK